MNRFRLPGRRRADERHDAVMAELAVLREQLTVVAEKVGELHDLSIEGRLPARILKP